MFICESQNVGESKFVVENREKNNQSNFIILMFFFVIENQQSNNNKNNIQHCINIASIQDSPVKKKKGKKEKDTSWKTLHDL